MDTESKEYDAELKMQSKCFQWHWNSYPDERKRLFHVNGKAKNAIEGSKFKAIGVVKGIADLCYLSIKGIVFIELKTPVGKQSQDQVEFEAVCKGLNVPYFICRNFENFKEIINNYQK